MSQHKVTLLLGSNLGNPENNLEIAQNLISNMIGEILLKSEILHSEAVEFVSNYNFCNIALVLNTQFSPVKLLNLIKKIEFDMGRTADSVVTNGYTDRIIDIDIVLFDEVKFESKRLQIPHLKHLYQREFSRTLLESIKTH